MEKIKLFIESENGKDILAVLIVILVGLGSFELGRLSKDYDTKGIKIEYASQTTNQTSNIVSTDLSAQNQNLENNVRGKIFFASARGSKYYTTSCSAGKTIKQENRVWFATGEEAQQAGYTLSSSCN